MYSDGGRTRRWVVAGLLSSHEESPGTDPSPSLEFGLRLPLIGSFHLCVIGANSQVVSAEFRLLAYPLCCRSVSPKT